MDQVVKNAMNPIGGFKGKRVLLTGHTGFKGTWMSVLLVSLGADLTGYALKNDQCIDFFQLSGIEKEMDSIIGDIRDLGLLKKAFDDVQPEIVIHMAAQPLVRESYLDPLGTYTTNVIGTANVLECVRLNPCVNSFVNVTTDKVYYNDERNNAFTELDPLDGYDPYSNSKSCSELVTHSYKNSFFSGGNCAISTARAGNVIGGGDFSKDRIIPDCVRATVNHEIIMVRNPYSTRPYQFVLDPILGYLLLAINPDKSGWYNIGPDDNNCFETGKLVDEFVRFWGDGACWESQHDGGPHEANYLKLDSTKFKNAFNWQPRYDLQTAMQKTVEWYKAWSVGENIRELMDKQISEFIGSNI